MANLQEKIAKLSPDATFEIDGTGILQATVPAKEWHDLAS